MQLFKKNKKYNFVNKYLSASEKVSLQLNYLVWIHNLVWVECHLYLLHDSEQLRALALPELVDTLEADPTLTPNAPLPLRYEVY